MTAPMETPAVRNGGCFSQAACVFAGIGGAEGIAESLHAKPAEPLPAAPTVGTKKNSTSYT